MHVEILVQALHIPGQVLQVLLLAYCPTGQESQYISVPVIKANPELQLVHTVLDVHALQLVGHCVQELDAEFR